jgi:hypothetical protein
MRHLAGVLVGGGLLAAAAAQVDVGRLGPQIGDVVPALRVTDHRGSVQTLASLAGPKGTMLVFFRSADW